MKCALCSAGNLKLSIVKYLKFDLGLKAQTFRLRNQQIFSKTKQYEPQVKIDIQF